MSDIRQMLLEQGCDPVQLDAMATRVEELVKSADVKSVQQAITRVKGLNYRAFGGKIPAAGDRALDEPVEVESQEGEPSDSSQGIDPQVGDPPAETEVVSSATEEPEPEVQAHPEPEPEPQASPMTPVEPDEPAAPEGDAPTEDVQDVATNDETPPDAEDDDLDAPA